MSFLLCGETRRLSLELEAKCFSVDVIKTRGTSSSLRSFHLRAVTLQTSGIRLLWGTSHFWRRRSRWHAPPSSCWFTSGPQVWHADATMRYVLRWTNSRCLARWTRCSHVAEEAPPLWFRAVPAQVALLLALSRCSTWQRSSSRDTAGEAATRRLSS